MRIAWVGTGVMGASMAGHLLDAGHEVVITTRTRSKAAALLDRGATWADSPSAAADRAEVACSMVGYPSDVRQVVLGTDGLLASLPPGALLVDFTTSDPALAAEIAESAAARGIDALDAPVSGGDVGARNATLSIMVGGTDAAVTRAEPLLRTLGATVVHQGGPGAGQHTKLVNQILIAGTMAGMCEALVYARAAGLDADRVLESVGGGATASWSLANLAPRILHGDLAPGFFVQHFVKDLGLALDHAERMGLDLPTLGLAKGLYASLAEHGGARDGTQALVVEVAAAQRAELAVSQPASRTTPAGFTAATVAAVVWGLGNVVVTGTPLNGMAQATHRFWLGSLLYLACLYGSGRRLTWASFRVGWLGGVALAGDIAFFFVAVKHTTLADAATIGALQPIVILLTAGALFGEKVRPRHIVCTVLTLAGTIAVVKGSTGGGGTVTVFGEVMAVLSLLSWAWYFIASKSARQQLDTLEYMTVIMIVGTVCVAPITLVTGQLTGPDSHLTWTAFFWVMVIVLLPGSGHVLINWAHNHTTITTSSLLTLLIPVLSAAGGAIWLDQSLDALQIGGIAVVLAALALVILLDARTARREVEVLEQLP